MTVAYKKYFYSTFAILSILLISESIYAQDSDSPRNAVYLELGGTGFLYSFNYEYHFNRRFAIRSGTMFLRYKSIEKQGDENQYQGLIIPITLNTFIGKRSHKLELGTGFVIQDFRVKNNRPGREERFIGLIDADNGGIGLSGVVGYRYQPTGEGILFRFGLSLDLAPAWDYDLGGAFGISFGYIF